MTPSMSREVDDPDAVKAVQHELNGKRREQDAEDLLGHEHPTLIQVVADAVRPSEHDDVEGKHQGEQAKHHSRK
jgi:hypothetical protein